MEAGGERRLEPHQRTELWFAIIVCLTVITCSIIWSKMFVDITRISHQAYPESAGRSVK